MLARARGAAARGRRAPGAPADDERRRRWASSVVVDDDGRVHGGRVDFRVSFLRGTWSGRERKRTRDSFNSHQRKQKTSTHTQTHTRFSQLLLRPSPPLVICARPRRDTPSPGLRG